MNSNPSRMDLIRDLFFILFSAFVLFFRLGSGSLATWDEATYGVIAREMFQTHHWLIPVYEGKVWLEKPPLCLWMIAFFYKMFGISELSVRLFSALCGWGTVLITYAFAAKLFNRWIGFLSGMILLTAKHFAQHARLGFMDAPLTFFISLALFFFWLGREKNGYFILSGIALGLAFLTKGFAAFVVIPITWIYCLWAKELFILKRPSYWLGIFLFLLITVPWNLYAVFTASGQYLTDFYQHVWVRFMSPSEGHEGSFGFYFRVIANKYRPWIFLLVPALPFFIFKTIRSQAKGMILVAVWIFCVLGLWTLVRTKLHWYIFPVYPALSICVAYVLGQIVKEKYALLVAVIFLITYAGHMKKNYFAADYNPDLKKISPWVKNIVPEGKWVSLYNSQERSGNFFYSERPTTSLSTKESFLEGARQDDFYCLAYKKDLQNLPQSFESLGLVVRASSGELLLLSKE